MTLLEEKKLVAEWMGWELDPKDDGDFLIHKPNTKSVTWLSTWNPQTDRNCWPEITVKMIVEERIKDIRNVMELLGYENTVEQLQSFDIVDCFRCHTAPPEVCWKALIRTINGGE